MTKKVSVIGGDKRFALLAAKMAADGYEVYTSGLDRFHAINAVPLEETIQVERVILPMPLSRDGEHLNCTEQKIPLRELWRKLSAGQKVYVGGMHETERAAVTECGVNVVDYLACEALAIRNAALTAEGALAAAVEATEFALHRVPCLVIGYGRIGKILAQRLLALGAKVSVSARRESDFAWIEAFGCSALHTNQLEGMLEEFRLVFNTVPQTVLHEKLLAELRPDCVLIELASCAGFDAAEAQKLGLSYIFAQGLPGKTAPESAANAIAETLYHLWREEK